MPAASTRPPFPPMATPIGTASPAGSFDEKDGGYVLACDPDISASVKAAGGGREALGGQIGRPGPGVRDMFRALAHDRPVLLVRGGISDLIDPAIVERMCAAAPQMAVVEVPGVGHAPMLTEPQAWTAIADLLDGAP